MNKFFIDIETAPCQKPGFLEEIKKTIQPTGNISKQETIDKWMIENADKAAEEQFRKTALNGTTGEIICIGWALNDELPQSLIRGVGESEAHLLQSFYSLIDKGQVWQIIGHNVLAFDARFLFHRSVINRVEPSFNLRQDERYSSGKVFDTMLAWAGWGNRISLKNLCAALDIPVKSDGLDGSKVYDYWTAGRLEEIADYCREDVEATRECWRRMCFFKGDPQNADDDPFY